MAPFPFGVNYALLTSFAVALLLLASVVTTPHESSNLSDLWGQPEYAAHSYGEVSHSLAASAGAGANLLIASPLPSPTAITPAAFLPLPSSTSSFSPIPDRSQASMSTLAPATQKAQHADLEDTCRQVTSRSACTRVAATLGAAFQMPRLNNDTIPATTEDRWAVWACADSPDSTAGRFLICRRDNCNVGDNVSADLQTATDLMALGGGPDDFWAELVGPEYVRLLPRHIGNCAYEAPFVVHIPGDYQLRLLHLYDHYNAISDFDGPELSFWPIIHLDNVLGNSTTVKLGIHGGNSASSDVARPSPKNLPVCTTNDEISQGHWITNVSVGYRSRRFNSFAEWPYPFSDALRWEPLGCHWEPMSLAAGRRCLAGKRIGMHGDSQTRTFFNLLLERMGGIGYAAQKGLMISQCWNFNASHPLLPDSTFCFTFNRFGSTDVVWAPPPGVNVTTHPALFAPSGQFRWDAVLLNYGQHPASHVHWSYRRYRESLQGYFPSIDRGAPTPSVVVWATTQDIGFPSGHLLANRRSTRDWRTHARLQYFSELSRRAFTNFTSVGRRCLMDSHAVSTQSMFLSNAGDGAHILHTGFHEVLQDLFLRCICSGGG